MGTGEKTIRRENFTQQTFINCACSGLNHVIRLRFEDSDEDGPFLDLEMMTPIRVGFWGRLWSFLKGNDCAYLGVDVVVDRESANQMIDALDCYLEALDLHEMKQGKPE